MYRPNVRGELIEAGLNDLYQRTGNISRTVKTFDPEMADHSCEMDMYGESHRYFFVGGTAVILALQKQAHDLSIAQLLALRRPVGEFKYIPAANYSPHEDSQRNCPELTFASMGDSIYSEYGRAIMLHIYTKGPSEPELIETVTGVQLNTLPFCYSCVPAMSNCKAAWPGMRISTQARDLTTGYYLREEHTLATMTADFRHRIAQNQLPPPSSYHKRQMQTSQITTASYLQSAIATLG